MYMVSINPDTCVGCGECTKTCPAKILTMVDGKAEATDASSCMGCQACVMTCPVEAITVMEL